MLRNKSSSVYSKNFLNSSFAYARQLYSQGLSAEQPNNVNGIAKLKGKIDAISQHHKQQQLLSHSGKTSIYRVPARLRNVEPRAYEPHFISIGPYHRGSPHLQDSERFKWDSLNRVLVGSEARAGVESEILLSALDAIEPEARSCYSEDVGLSRDEFVEMMLLDGCFIVELLRDLKQSNFKHSSLLPKRSMLPVVRRDLINLENQIPLMVLKIIQEKIMSSESDTESMEETSIEGLALNFLDPLMPREDALLQQSIASITSSSQKFHHLLDVFHSSITPGSDVVRDKEPSMCWPITEMEKTRIKVRVLTCGQPLDVQFENKELLKLPTLVINNHTSTVVRNVVAYEQCHDDCNPDMTTYLFFLGKVINSAKDVEILQGVGVLRQNLGSNKQVAELIKNLCFEVEHDGQYSYLHEVINKVNSSYAVRLRLRCLMKTLRYYYMDPLRYKLICIAGLYICASFWGFFTAIQDPEEILEATADTGNLSDAMGDLGTFLRYVNIKI